MQAVQPYITDEALDADIMSPKDVSEKLERLTGRVTTIEKELKKPRNRDGNNWPLITSILALVVTVVGLPIMLLAWIEPHLESDLKNTVSLEVGNQLKQPLADQVRISNDLSEIKGKLEILDPLIRDLTEKRMREAQSLNHKDLQAHVTELTKLAKFAKAQQLLLKPEAIEAVGDKLIDEGTSSAWGAALTFVNYKSFLNVSLTLQWHNVIGNGNLNTLYVTHSPQGMRAPKFSVLGAVEADRAAKFLTIGQTDPNATSRFGNDWIIADGGGLVLDNVHLKKVVLRNVYIEYNGGPLEMEEVYFLNCTFSIKQHPNGQSFAIALLKPPPFVSFNAG